MVRSCVIGATSRFGASQDASNRLTHENSHASPTFVQTHGGNVGTDFRASVCSPATRDRPWEGATSRAHGTVAAVHGIAAPCAAVVSHGIARTRMRSPGNATGMAPNVAEHHLGHEGAGSSWVMSVRRQAKFGPESDQFGPTWAELGPNVAKASQSGPRPRRKFDHSQLDSGQIWPELCGSSPELGLTFQDLAKLEASMTCVGPSFVGVGPDRARTGQPQVYNIWPKGQNPSSSGQNWPQLRQGIVAPHGIVGARARWRPWGRRRAEESRGPVGSQQPISPDAMGSPQPKGRHTPQGRRSP